LGVLKVDLTLLIDNITWSLALRSKKKKTITKEPKDEKTFEVNF